MSSGNQTLARGNLPPVDKFTPVEEKIVGLLDQGKTIQEIADSIGVKRSSVQRRMETINEKLSTLRIEKK